MADTGEIITFNRDGSAQYTVKRSRFLSFAHRILSQEEARDFIGDYRKRFADATHVVWAYVLPGVDGYSDAGEPKGTAGPPALRALKSFGVTHGLVVVVRYFGGVKLGKRGLIDAYGHAARLACEDAGVGRYAVGFRYRLCCPYGKKPSVELWDARDVRWMYGEHICVEFSVAQKPDVDDACMLEMLGKVLIRL